MSHSSALWIVAMLVIAGATSFLIAPREGTVQKWLYWCALPVVLVGLGIVGFGVGDGIVAACFVMVLPTVACLRYKNFR